MYPRSPASTLRSPGVSVSPLGSPKGPQQASWPRLWDALDVVASDSTPPLTLLSWNTLMDTLDHGFSYLHVEHSDWDMHRGSLVIHELERHGADIIALQEVNRVETIARAFSETYTLLYAPKLSGVSIPGEGCALLVRRSRLEVCEVDTLYYKTTMDQNSPLSNQTAQVVLLRDKLNLRYLVACNTHLKASQTPEAEALRCSQVQQLVSAARAMRTRGEDRSGGAGSELPVPVVMLGDFNTYPGQRPYMTLLTTFGAGLHSAYNAFPRGGMEISDYSAGEPPFTTYKFRGGRDGHGISEKRVCEDFIFFSEGLSPQALLRLPTVEDIGKWGLPSPVFPSDHLCLGLKATWA